MSVCPSPGLEGEHTEILFADTTVVLPWLKANKWGPPDLVTRVASLTAHSLGSFYWVQSPPCRGSVWHFKLEALEIPLDSCQDEVVKEVSLWLILA